MLLAVFGLLKVVDVLLGDGRFDRRVARRRLAQWLILLFDGALGAILFFWRIWLIESFLYHFGFVCLLDELFLERFGRRLRFPDKPCTFRELRASCFLLGTSLWRWRFQLHLFNSLFWHGLNRLCFILFQFIDFALISGQQVVSNSFFLSVQLVLQSCRKIKFWRFLLGFLLLNFLWWLLL
mgnify:FL=1